MLNFKVRLHFVGWRDVCRGDGHVFILHFRGDFWPLL